MNIDQLLQTFFGLSAAFLLGGLIGFELAGRLPMVRCTLERDQAGARAQFLDYTLDPAALGIPDRLDRLQKGNPGGNP